MPQYFAEIDKNNIVLRVIVADQDFINSGAVGDPANWIETFMDGSERKNYAGIGYTYDLNKNGFIPEKFYASWALDPVTLNYVAPIPKPQGDFAWSESMLQWIPISIDVTPILDN